jgi:glutamyl-tRNA reductase
MLSQSLTNKLMHGPTAALHDVQEIDRGEVVRLIERVYQVRGRE